MRPRPASCATTCAPSRRSPQGLPAPPFLPFLPLSKPTGRGILARITGAWIRHAVQIREVEMFHNRWTLGAAGFALLLTSASISRAASASGTLTFNSFSTGQKIDTEYVNEYGITISARNAAGGPNVATLYNSGSTSGADSNLMAPFDRGNLAGKSLSKLLIIAANDTDANGDGKIDKPDNAA